MTHRGRWQRVVAAALFLLKTVYDALRYMGMAYYWPPPVDEREPQADWPGWSVKRSGRPETASTARVRCWTTRA